MSPVWTIERRELAPGTVEHRLLADGARVPTDDVLAAWEEGDEPLARALTETLAASAFEGFLWETPPVREATVGRPFEFVLVESASLARMRPEPEVFAEHYAAAEDGLATFPNLGGDAVLVAPVPGAGDSWPHLGAFCRRASPERATALWRAVGRAARVELGPRPLWISTCGLGVAWLHVRLDSRPKYYRHDPYRVPD